MTSVPARAPATTAFRSWYPLVAAVAFLYAWTPWLAPVFLQLGWDPPARMVYAIYSTQCHQLADRSFFLFGPQVMYSSRQLAAETGLTSIADLRSFQGSANMGWKVAWSDRMVAIYSSLSVFLIAYPLVRSRMRPFSPWTVALLLLPLAVDGGTHLLSDLSGLGRGFRGDNLWLATITKQALPPEFYTGNGWGSFNSIARMLSGTLFGLALAGFIGPRLLDASGPLREADPAPAGLRPMRDKTELPHRSSRPPAWSRLASVGRPASGLAGERPDRRSPDRS